MNCFNCGRSIPIAIGERLSFRASCPACDGPAHVCLNCEFYAQAYNNQCREPQAERVVDKDRANFCEYFAPGQAQPHAALSSPEPRARLEALFKKKS
jgi:hypothetical protein